MVGGKREGGACKREGLRWAWWCILITQTLWRLRWAESLGWGVIGQPSLVVSSQPPRATG